MINNTNIRFLFNNLIESENATLAATPSVYGELPESNLLLVGDSSIMRVPATSYSLTCTWGSAQQIDTVVVGKHNLTNSATVTFQLFTVATDTVPVATKVFSYVDQIFSWIIDNESFYTIEKIKVIVQDDTNTDGYLDLGRIAAGKAFIPQHTIKAGATKENEYTGKSSKSMAGSTIVFPGFSYKILKVSLDFLSFEERDELDYFFRNAGITKSFFATVYPNWTSWPMERDHQGFFHLDGKNPPLSHNFMDEFSLSITLSDSEIITNE